MEIPLGDRIGSVLNLIHMINMKHGASSTMKLILQYMPSDDDVPNIDDSKIWAPRKSSFAPRP